MTDPRNSTKSARLPALALKMHKAAAALAGSRRARRCNPSRRARASSCQYSSAWIEPRQHIVTVVGSNSALVQGGWLKEGRRENDDETARRADFIVTNWRETVEQERQAGLFGPLERGVITWDKIHELGEILNGTYAGRTSEEQITFQGNNNGTAAADLAIAQWVYLQCKQMGRGSPIELPRLNARQPISSASPLD